jgi:hypothetical protein
MIHSVNRTSLYPLPQINSAQFLAPSKIENLQPFIMYQDPQDTTRPMLLPPYHRTLATAAREVPPVPMDVDDDESATHPNERVFIGLSNDDYVSAKKLAREVLKSPQDEPLWHSTEDVIARVEKLRTSKALSDPKIARFTAELTGCPIEALSNRIDVIKYATHLYSFDKKLYKINSECWSYEPMLLQRIRSLVTFLVRDKEFSKTALGDLTQPQAKQKVYRELSIALEALRLQRRFSLVEKTKTQRQDRNLQAVLLDFMTRTLTSKLASLKPDTQEFLVPLGWPGHAFYAGFQVRSLKGVPTVSMCIDNLGQDSEFHRTVKDKTLSYLLNIPQAYFHERHQATFDMLKEFVRHMANLQTRFRVGLFPSLIQAYEKRLAKEHSQNVVSAGQYDLHAHKSQTVGNCVLKNYHPGMRRRLGGLFKELKHFEREQAAVNVRAQGLSLEPLQKRIQHHLETHHKLKAARKKAA